MNGIVELKIGDQVQTLRYNVQACMLFQDYYSQNAVAYNTREGEIKLLGDLFYCGVYGNAIRSQKAIPSYEEVMDLFDTLGSQENFLDATEKIWTTYTESTWGKEIFNLGMEVQKKKEEMLKNQPPNL